MNYGFIQLISQLTNPNPVASAQQQLGVNTVERSQASINKPSTISPTDQTEILKTISDGYALKMTDGKVENVGTFFTILENYQDSILSKGTKAYITQIKGNFEEVKTDLEGKSPLDESTIAAVVPHMLDGIHQLFEFVSLLDDGTGKNKPSFQKIAEVALDCKTKFQSGPAKSRMIKHIQKKLDYFLQKDDSSQLISTDPLTSITIFADVDSNLQCLFQSPTVIPPQAQMPTLTKKLNQTQDLKASPILQSNWQFSTGPISEARLHSLTDLASENVTSGRDLKNDNRISDDALEQIKRLTEENMKALEKNEQEVLLQNLKKLKDAI